MKDLVAKSLSEIDFNLEKDTAAKATAKATKKATARKPATRKVKARKFHRVNQNLSGKLLFAYTLAILDTLGGLTVARKPFKGRAWTSFYNSATALSHHKRNGNVEALDGGLVKLTSKGLDHFKGRLDGTNGTQGIDRATVNAFKSAIKSGKVPAELKDNGLKLSTIEV